MMLLHGCGSGAGGATSFSSSSSSSRSSSSPSFRLARPPSVVARASSASRYYGSSTSSSRAPSPTSGRDVGVMAATTTNPHRRRRSAFVLARATASSSDDEQQQQQGATAPAPPTTAEEAYAVLGLDPASVRTFEDVVAAKNRAFSAAPEGQPGSAEARQRAEAAYDLLFMRDMRRRLSGETEVSASVRYADVAPAPRRGPGSGGGKGAAAAKPGGGLGALFGGGGGGGGRGAASSSPSSAPVRGIRAGSPSSSSAGRARASSSSSSSLVAVRPVAGEQALQLAAVFGGLAAFALATALLEPAEAQARDVAALPLALAGAFSVYSLRGAPKRLSLARASGITAAAAAVGVLAGTALNAWLRVDILPLGAFGSPGVLSADAAILAIWTACALLE
jgi:hypothetical protein